MIGRSVVFASLLGAAGLSVTCGDAGSLPAASPTPMPAPTPAPPVLSVRSVLPSSGPTMGGDYFRISGTGFQPGATVTLDGNPAEVRSVNSASLIDARTPAHALGTVDVVVTNPDGQTARLTAAYTYATFAVTANESVVAPGADLTVSFTAPAGRGCSGGGDWIAVYPVGAPDQTGAANFHTDLWHDHTCGATSGTWPAKAPDESGRYEFRYMVGDFSVARSNAFEVRAQR